MSASTIARTEAPTPPAAERVEQLTAQRDRLRAERSVETTKKVTAARRLAELAAISADESECSPVRDEHRRAAARERELSDALEILTESLEQATRDAHAEALLVADARVERANLAARDARLAFRKKFLAAIAGLMPLYEAIERADADAQGAYGNALRLAGHTIRDVGRWEPQSIFPARAGAVNTIDAMEYGRNFWTSAEGVVRFGRWAATQPDPLGPARASTPTPVETSEPSQ